MNLIFPKGTEFFGCTTRSKVVHQDTVSHLQRWWSHSFVIISFPSHGTLRSRLGCEWVSFLHRSFLRGNILRMWLGTCFSFKIKDYINWQTRTPTKQQKKRRITCWLVNSTIVCMNEFVYMVLPARFVSFREGLQHTDSVRFILSTKPFPCGWYGVVQECITPDSSSSLLNNRFSNLPPMSWWILSGNPKRGIKSLKILSAAVIAVLFLVEYGWANLVKWSTTTSNVFIAPWTPL